MSVIDTLITDRVPLDVDRVRELAKKVNAGTATLEELAEWNSIALKGSYDYTDLNRVSEAIQYLDSMLRSNGYESGVSWGTEDYTYTPDPSVPQASMQFLETVYVNGNVVNTAAGYDDVETAISQAVQLEIPKTSTTKISYQTKFAIDLNGKVTTTRAYSNFNVYASKTAALAFTQAAVANGGAERSFTGFSEGYCLMIATENYGSVAYYAYVFSDEKKPSPAPEWAENEYLTPAQASLYLANVQALRDTIALYASTPEIHGSMEGLNTDMANSIEQILVDLYATIKTMLKTRVACGDAYCGGEYL